MPTASPSSSTGSSLFMKLPFIRTSNDASAPDHPKAPSPIYTTSPSSISPTTIPSWDAAVTAAAAQSSSSSSAAAANSATSPTSPTSRSAPRTRQRKGSLRKVALSRGALTRGAAVQSPSSPTAAVHDTLSEHAHPIAADSSDSGPSPRSSTDSEGTTPWPAFEDSAAAAPTGLGLGLGLGVCVPDSAYASTDDDDALHITRLRSTANGNGSSARSAAGALGERSASSSSATPTLTPTSLERPRLTVNPQATRKKAAGSNTGIGIGNSSSSEAKTKTRSKHGSSHSRHAHTHTHTHTHTHAASATQHIHHDAHKYSHASYAHSRSHSLRKPTVNPSPLSNASVPPTVATTALLPLATADDMWDYSETAWWGWIILITTWIVFVTGMGSCFGVWSWAWDVGTTPYAPPELEDDPTLPITGYYPALIILSGVMAWVWVTIAWVGMKYFRHAKISGD